MCGIAGLVQFDASPVEQGRLESARGVLDPRGPDGCGVFLESGVGLLHTRLAVVDIVGGHQPMVYEDETGERIAVAFNGEVYNHRELRIELERMGHRFTTDHSDTEVLLHGYRAWGTDLVQHLRGMFAFVIWDRAGGTVMLARDPFGKKPIYYHHTRNRLVIGSTVAAVCTLIGQKPSIDMQGLGEYLTLGYTHSQSLVKDVHELTPGHVMVADSSGKVSFNRYVSLPGSSNETNGNGGTLLDVDNALQDAVVRRLEADVPVGCFLSGGIDSSVIAAIAQRKLAPKCERIKTFTVVMDKKDHDESKWAKAAALYIGSDHRELPVKIEFIEDLRYLVQLMGEPFGDSSILPTYWLSRAVREHVTVALSGDGGDELFGGYDRYRAMGLIGRHGWWLKRIPRAFIGDGTIKSKRGRMRRLTAAAEFASANESYLDMIRLFDGEAIKDMGFDGVTGIKALSNWVGNTDGAYAARRWDMHHYLPSDLLTKVDRASMAAGLEVRCPFLDLDVSEAAARLPKRLTRWGKVGLKKVARRYLPQTLIKRKKMGFALPIGAWFQDELKPLITSYLMDGPQLRELGVRREAMETLIGEHSGGIRDHSQRIFALLSLSVWMEWAGV